MAFLISIPVPPSTNKLYGVGRGGRRYLLAGYRRWRANAGYMINSQKPEPVTGRYKLFLSVPKTRKDTDNMIKATLDLLVAMKLTPDDRHCAHCEATVIPELKDFATVSVEAA